MSILDQLEPPTRNDFHRGANGVPYVRLDGKRTPYKRASSAGSILDDESNLDDWKLRTVLYGASQRMDLCAKASVLDPELDKGPMRDLVEECLVAGKGTVASGMGAALHRMLDRIDLGDEWSPSPQWSAVVEAYRRVRDQYGLVPIDVEVHCVNDARRIAGTMDRRYQLTKPLMAPDGEVMQPGSVKAGDTKTGKNLEYARGTYATQLAAYAESVRYDITTDERTPFDPPTDQDWALIVHLNAREGTCELHWVDLELGRKGLDLAQTVRDWRKLDTLTPVLARPPLALVPLSKASQEGPLTVTAGTPESDNVQDSLAALVQDLPSHGFVVALSEPEEPAEASQVPQEATEQPERAEDPQPALEASQDLLEPVRVWLRDRVAAIKARGTAPVAMLMREWPEGVPGLKWSTQTEDQLNDIVDVCWRVEAEYALSFPDRDPRDIAKDEGARYVAPVTPGQLKTEAGVEAFMRELKAHPRWELLKKWLDLLQLDSVASDKWWVAYALREFAELSQDEWSDADLDVMLDGSIRAIGFEAGLAGVSQLSIKEAPLITSAAFAIAAGTAMVLFDEYDRPVVRTITQP